VGGIKDEAGQIWEKTEEVGKAFVNYFAKLFTKGPKGDIR
jgi:hypothetical protein